jgi:hypothetical protein
MSVEKNYMLGWLGLRVSGDVADFTFYTNRRGKVVFFLFAPPNTPPSAAQTSKRNAMARIAGNWRLIPGPQRANWRRACLKLHLEVVGFGLFFHLAVKKDLATIRTIERQSNLTLLTTEVFNQLQIQP